MPGNQIDFIHDLYAGMVEAIPFPVITFDKNGVILYLNNHAETLIGLKSLRLINKKITTIFPEDDNHEFYRQIKEGHYKASVRAVLMTNYHGEHFSVIRLGSFHTKHNQIIVAVIGDLYQHDLLDDKIINYVSHELRSPLTAIIAYTGMMLMMRDKAYFEEHLEHTQIIKDSANHLLSIINDSLELIKIESGVIKPNLTNVDVAEICEKANSLYHKLAIEKGVQLHFTKQNYEVISYCDHKILLMIISKLLSNAVKYTERGDIYIQYNSPDINKSGFNTIQILNTGKGISPENMSKLFKPFANLSEQKSKYEGLGIGLYAALKLASLIHAHIECSSEPDAMTQFIIHLPVKKALSADNE